MAESRRRTMLADAAIAEGCAWAGWWRGELARQGRPMVGGWPGTMSEARTRITRRLACELAGERRASTEEIEEASRSAYDIARRRWDAGSDPDHDPTSAEDFAEVP